MAAVAIMRAYYRDVINVSAETARTITNQGHLISMVAKKRLLMTACAAIHQALTSIPIDSQSMTWAFIMSLDPQREQDLAYSEPRAIDKPQRDTSMSKWLDSVDN